MVDRKLAKPPKLHSLLDHALKKAREIGGFGDMLEDNVEMMHQIAGRFESRASKIKRHEKQAFSHTKTEAILQDVQNNIKESQLKSKRPLLINKKKEKVKR
jgi:hypothetical protein